VGHKSGLNLILDLHGESEPGALMWRGPRHFCWLNVYKFLKSVFAFDAASLRFEKIIQ